MPHFDEEIARLAQLAKEAAAGAEDEPLRAMSFRIRMAAVQPEKAERLIQILIEEAVYALVHGIPKHRQGETALVMVKLLIARIEAAGASGDPQT